MAFVLSKKQSYAWPVKVRLPSGGRWETHSFTATFAKLPPLEVQQRLRALADPELSPEGRYEAENEFMEEVLMGWEGIKDENEVPVAFSTDARAAILDVTEVRRALFEAFFESASGKRAEAKN